MRRPTACIGKNKCEDQLGSNCMADELICFPCTESIIPLLLKSEMPASVTKTNVKINWAVTAWLMSSFVFPAQKV